MSAFVPDLQAMIAARFPQMRQSMFGHLGDANTHISALARSGLPMDLTGACYETVAEYGGRFLRRMDQAGQGSFPRADTRATELALFRELKAAFDPEGF